MAGEPVKTNSKLPEDSIIHPLPAALASQKVTAVFREDKVLSEVIQGDWIRSEHLLIYEITSGGDASTGRELRFICRDTNPAPESGIRLKRLPWPFKKDSSMSFWLKRDESCSYTAFYGIEGYQEMPTRTD